jgi:predicted regulator of Ras-like GTPase activity (Roadblock/LC7/MglB family)
MNDEIHSVALKSALAEIAKAYTDAKWLFVLANDGTVITNNENALEDNMSKAAESFQSLAEKAKAVGGLDNMLINGEKSKVFVSNLEDMYLIAGLTQKADLTYFRTLTSAVLPTVLKVVDSIASSPFTPAPTPFKTISPVEFPSAKPAALKAATLRPIASEPRSDEQEAGSDEEPFKETPEFTEPKEPSTDDISPKELSTDELSSNNSERSEEPEPLRQSEDVPSQQLIVDRFSGLMVKADTVQLDSEVLTRWSALLNAKEIKEVDIESFGGKTTRCKTKPITDAKLGGRGLIRIPEKTCQTLELRRGELVRVKPVMPEEGD